MTSSTAVFRHREHPPSTLSSRSVAFTALSTRERALPDRTCRRDRGVLASAWRRTGVAVAPPALFVEPRRWRRVVGLIVVGQKPQDAIELVINGGFIIKIGTGLEQPGVLKRFDIR